MLEQTESHPEIVVSESPTEADIKAIKNGLISYNERHAPNHNYKPLTIVLRDPNSGETVGGVVGESLYDWLFVSMLVVPEKYRGRDLGTALLRKAEEIAREWNCLGIWLDTFEFQARGFYEKNGFHVFGTLDHPGGLTRYFLKKLFV